MDFQSLPELYGILTAQKSEIKVIEGTFIREYDIARAAEKHSHGITLMVCQDDKWAI